MSRKVDEGVVGTALAIVFCATGLIVLSLAPLPASFSEHMPVVFGPAMIILALLGVGIGIAITRLAKRRPSKEPADDYDDKPPVS